MLPINDLYSDGYEAYLRSPEWQAKRRERIELDHHTCQICCRQDQPLEVHHRSYRNLGNEEMDDLITVCRTCHKAITAIERGLKELNYEHDVHYAEEYTRIYKRALAFEVVQLIMDTVVDELKDFPELRNAYTPITGDYISNILEAVRENRQRTLREALDGISADPKYIATLLKSGTFKKGKLMAENAMEHRERIKQYYSPPHLESPWHYQSPMLAIPDKNE